MSKALCIKICFLTVVTLIMPDVASAATVLPGGADVDRARPIRQELLSPQLDMGITNVPEASPQSQPPASAKSISFILKDVRIEGVTAYKTEEMEPFYREDIGKEISLDKVWAIASAITDRYRADGYFLSRAYVPAQEVSSGTVTLRVVEGYIGEVEVADREFAKTSLVKDIMAAITAERPTKISTLERQHLLLSDIPGMDNYQGTLVPYVGNEGAVKLIFSKRSQVERNTFINFDNYGSQYLGPQQLSAGWKGDVISMQRTSISGAVSVPTKELAAVNVSHFIPLTPSLSLEVVGGVIKSEPGYTLSVQEIESSAVNIGVGLNYQLIRQRRENLKLTVAIDARNSHSTILGAELSKDKIRALRFKGAYDNIDDWQGYNFINGVLSHGISGLGASEENDVNLSRAGAKPGFTKLEIEYKRLQYIDADWGVLLSIMGQKASGSLYSSEEFGYGGQTFGRAYDQSEISGDEGISAGLELRYQGVPEWRGLQGSPFAFYDIGRVWNSNLGQKPVVDAASAGAGVRLNHENGLSGTVQLAFPLTRSTDAPLYSGNNASPRLGVQVGYAF